MALEKLIEKFSVQASMIKREPLQESTNSKVLIENEEKNCYGVYSVPIWRLDKENLNGRIYTRKLAEKLCEDNSVTFSLKDHPEEGKESVDNIVGVAKDPFIKNGILYAYGYLIDKEFADKLNKAIALKAPFGVSSSGLGEVDKISKRVNEDSYQLERYFDYVLDPSYQVYITEDCKVVKEEIENKPENKLNESKEDTKNTELTAIEEKNIKKNINERIEKLDKLTNIKEKLDGYKDVLSWFTEGFNDTELKKVIEDKVKICENKVNFLVKKTTEITAQKNTLTEENKIIMEENANLVETIENLQKKVTELSEKNKVAYSLLDNVKQYSNKLKQLKEADSKKMESMVSVKEFNEVMAFVEKVEKENDSLKEKIVTLQNNGKKLAESEKTAKAEIIEYYNSLHENNHKVIAVKDEILRCESLFEAKRTYLKLKDLLEETPRKVETIKESVVVEKVGKQNLSEVLTTVDTMNNSSTSNFNYTGRPVSHLKEKDWI